MRRILVENARKKRSLKAGGQRHRIDLDEALIVDQQQRHDLVEPSRITAPPSQEIQQIVDALRMPEIEG